MKIESSDNSTRRLIQLCLGYFLTYVITGVSVKYYLGLGMQDFEFLVYSTAGAMVVPTLVCVALRWYRFEPHHHVRLLGAKIPFEFFYLLPSGLCTAIIIPTTTLMYSLPYSVMVSMIIMRAAVIILSRLVDSVQIKQGYLKKKVYAEENWGVVFAMLAMGIPIFSAGKGGFDFLSSMPATIIFSSYIIAYAIRIYIMNYYKNVAAVGAKRDNKAFFAIEQFFASGTLIALSVVWFYSLDWFGLDVPQVRDFRGAFLNPHAQSLSAAFWGIFFGMVAFFSVFIFIFKGRTATFAGLVNRLTSLIAGTAATAIFWLFFDGKAPANKDWLALLLMFVAIWFSSRAERRRVAELKTAHELVDDSDEADTVSVSVKIECVKP